MSVNISGTLNVNSLIVETDADIDNNVYVTNVSVNNNVSVINTITANTINANTINANFSNNTTAVTQPLTDISTKIATTAFVAPSFNDMGRNLFHNPLFNIAQRGGGPFTGLSSYTLDRWLCIGVSDTVSFTQVNLGDSDRSSIGDEAAIRCLQNVFTGNSGASAYSRIEQRIESMRRLAGKTVTISFYAKAASGTPQIGLNIFQYPGTGGSPSTGQWALAIGNAVTLSTTWNRYSTTISIPSSSGVTLGTNGDDSSWIAFAFSSGSTNNATFGNIGVQSGTIQFWGMQIEIGNTLSPLAKPDPAYDIYTCLRFYQRLAMFQATFCTGASQAAGTSTTFLVPMRGPPNVSVLNNFSSNYNLPSPGLEGSSGVFMNGSSVAGGNVVVNVIIECIADL